jgi:hypothetical protein
MDDLNSTPLELPVEQEQEQSAPAPRGLPRHLIDPPERGMVASVVVPVRDEAKSMPRLLGSLVRQRTPSGVPVRPDRFEVILLCNGCRDGSAAVARRAAAASPALRLHVLDLGPSGIGGGVGRARRLLMDEAADRLTRVGQAEGGVVLTTDADTLVAPDWLAANLAEIEGGADAVGGQVLLQPEHLARLAPDLRRRYLDDHSYQRLRATLDGLIDPDPDDPLPRHHQHAGASLAVTVDAYWRAGGMPPLRSGEDEAFYRAIRRSGGRFRHSLRVRTSTSGRLVGRAEKGLAGTLSAWGTEGEGPLVESALSIERRLLGRRFGGSTGQPAALEPVADAIRGLRALIRRYSGVRSSRSSR